MVMRNEAAKVTLASIAASTATYIAWAESDEHATLVVVATGATTLTVLAGNGIQGAADRDISLSGAGTYLIRLDSGFFKNTTGTNKGKIGIKASAAITAGVVYQV